MVSPSLNILANLCYNNMIVVRLMLTTMSSDERKDLFSKDLDDTRSKVSSFSSICKFTFNVFIWNLVVLGPLAIEPSVSKPFYSG